MLDVTFCAFFSDILHADQVKNTFEITKQTDSIYVRRSRLCSSYL